MLKAIKNLHAQGKISDTEYKKRKQKLLGDVTCSLHDLLSPYIIEKCWPIIVKYG
tara:strand:+ start:1963 stop:2127 length:165 start_codon:yes stop_codon:yes gene_type:complete